MRLRAAVKKQVVKRLFSIERRNEKRAKVERERQAAKAPHVVEYFHEAGDPYSHLMVQLLPEFMNRYDVELRVHIVPSPPEWAAPDRARLETYSRADAARLARRAGIKFDDPDRQPSAAALGHANAAFIAAVNEGAFLNKAADIGHHVWTNDLSAPDDVVSPQAVSDALDASAARRDKLGHYLGATLYYGGEWYWGPDRLHFLERRLQDLGAAKSDVPKAPIFEPPGILHDMPSGAVTSQAGNKPELHWYLSFRSPYTGIVADRVRALADAYGAEIKLRYVLPMVMRGMQVPRMKGVYIMSDAIREAERLDIPFGNFADPVGEPVERGYAVLHEAINCGKGFEFVQSFLSGVWAEGVDAGSNKGLRTITERAGLSWDEMKLYIGNNAWRAVAETNQQEMFDHGVWGVPSFRVGKVTAWGQDRLWVIEDALKSMRN